jgi:hypothetical protein
MPPLQMEKLLPLETDATNALANAAIAQSTGTLL